MWDAELPACVRAVLTAAVLTAAVLTAAVLTAGISSDQLHVDTAESGAPVTLTNIGLNSSIAR